MPDEKTYPFDDDYMVFDELMGQYVITEKALMDRGINIRARLSETAAVTPEAVISTLVHTASDMIYQFIHEHNVDNAAQDCFIAKCPQVRPVIFRALLYQAVYICNVGNLYLSTKDEERGKAIDKLAESVLGNVIPGFGISLLYTGRLV